MYITYTVYEYLDVPDVNLSLIIMISYIYSEQLSSIYIVKLLNYINPAMAGDGCNEEIALVL